MLLFKRAKRMQILFCLCFLQPLWLCAQEIPVVDTMKVSLQQVEKIFLDSNLQLLAEHYNIKSASALVDQAKKWDNPLLITDQNVYTNRRFFHHGNTQNGVEDGQFFVQIEQLIKTAGKRGKQVAMANTNVSIAEWQFKSVMRSLRAALVKDFYNIAQLRGNALLYNNNMERLLRLEAGMEKELAAGNIARKEYVRVEALIIVLRHDMIDNEKDLSDAESELKTLLQMPRNVFIVPDVENLEPAADVKMNLLTLLDSARANNPDYMQQVYELQYNKQNVRLQKALAVPDLTVGPEFDQSSNYTSNYYGLTLSLPLPIFDRNKGNIRSAGYLVQREEALLKQADVKLQNDVMNAYHKLLLNINLSNDADTCFYKDYYDLFNNIIESYNKRQISMIEFLEYFTDYQEVRKNQLKQVYNLRMSKEELNEAVGIDVVK